MPRNVSGTYSLPLPPVVANTVIQSAWANTTTDDIAQGITDSLDRNGRGGMIAPFRLVDGSEIQPAFSFSSETGTGLWRESPGLMAVSIMGVKVAGWSAADYSVLTDFNVTGNLGVTGDILFAGDILGTITVTGGIAVAGGITSLDDVSSTQDFDGAAGFFATNLSALTHSYAVFRATNNLAHSVGLAAVGSANVDFPSNADTGVLFSDHAGGTSFVTTHASGVMKFYTAGFNERMQLNAAGCLGIGIVPTTVKLHVSDTQAGVARFNSTAASGTYLGIANNTSLKGRIGVGSSTVSTAGVNDLGIRLENTGNIMFSANSGTEHMRIDSSGRVGIAMAPLGGAILDMKGLLRAFNDSGSTQGLRLLNSTQVNGVTLAVNEPPNNTGYLSSDTAAMTFWCGGSEVMRMGTDGLVVINRPSGAVIADGRLQVHDAAKVPNIAFVKNGIQGWYVGGDKSGASNRFDISANAGPLFTINPTSGFAGINNTTGQDILSLASYGTGAVTEMAVYGPYGSASLANVYVGTMGNGGGKVELNGHTSASTLASWQMLHHSDIAGQDLVFRFSSGGATRSAFSYTERFRIESGGGAYMTTSTGAYRLAVDPGPTAANIPVGAIVFGQAVISGGGAALSGLGTFVCGSGGQQISWGPYTGGATTVTITHGTWRNIGAQTVGGVGLFMRVA